MKLSSISLAGLVACVAVSAGFGQRPGFAPVAVVPPIDIYEHFVGTWVGTTRVLEPGAEVATNMKVEVTEDANRSHLRFFLTFSVPGQSGFEHVTRVATLDPLKGEMRWLQSDNPTAPDSLRHTVGLGAFARKGYGVFDASYVYGYGSHHLERRCRYVLDPDLFGYAWYESVDGGPFTKYSVTQLTRESPAVVALLGP